MEVACIIVPFVILAFVLYAWRLSHSSDRLQTWASENGYTLVSVERRQMFRGGYSFTTGKGQEVFRVTVRDGEGRTRSGYVRVGGWVMGQLSDNIDVKWD